jgi:hypothetical protein
MVARRGDVLFAEVLLHDVLVGVGDGLEQLVAPLLGNLEVVVRDVPVLPLLAHAVGRPVAAAHLDQVDDAVELALDAPWQLHGGRDSTQPVDDHVDRAVELGPDAVHLVDEADPRDVVLVGLAPHRLGLGLDTADGVEDGDRAVEHTQRPLDLDREVDVAGRVDDVDPVVLPATRRRRGRDGDAALLLVHHPVHDGRALVDLTDLVGATGVVQDPLGRGGLARVDVGHDPDVARARERELANRDPALAG